MIARNVTRGTVLASDLEVASSLWSRFLGLMGRPSLPEGHGLLLDGTNGIHMFFMRFPIDCVFLDRPNADGERRVVAVYRGVRPWTGIIPYVRGGHGVLELPAGTIAESTTVVGDLVSLTPQ